MALINLKNTFRTAGASTLGTQIQPTGLSVLGATSGKNNSSNNKSSGGGGASSSAANDSAILNGYIDMFYGAYRVDPVQYEAKSDETLRDEIIAWLRPGFDAAIENRKSQTNVYKAELDADAIARGMGASTYVTDVKSRQQNTEASDILSLESDYGAQLAKYFSDASNTERDRALEVQMFNKQNEQEAYLAAYNAAVSMFATYKSKGRGGSRSSGSANVLATTQENCELFLDGLTGDERRGIYQGNSPQDQRYQAELIASVGPVGYMILQQKYPALPKNKVK